MGGSSSSFTFTDTQIEFNPYIFEPKNVIFNKNGLNFDNDMLIDLKSGLKEQLNPFLDVEEVTKDLEPLNQLKVLAVCKIVEILWMILLVISLFCIFILTNYFILCLQILLSIYISKLILIMISMYQIDNYLKYLNELKYSFRGQKWYLEKCCKGNIGCKVVKKIIFNRINDKI